MSTTELIIIIVMGIILITDITHTLINITQTKKQINDMQEKIKNKDNIIQKILPYEDLFRLLDVIIVNEVTNYIAINNIKDKTSTSISVALQDTIIELSNKIYTDGISRNMITQLEYYVTTKFIMEYISRSIRNNLVSSTIPTLYKK